MEGFNMKKVLTVSILTLSFVFGMMMMPKEVEAKCSRGAYVSSKYLVQDPNYRPDRSGIGHYIVKINSGYLNVRETPSMNGKIIGKLYNGAKVTTSIRFCSEPGWAQITSPSF